MNNLLTNKQKLKEYRLTREKFLRYKYRSEKEYIYNIKMEYKKWIEWKKNMKELNETVIEFYKNIYGNRKNLNSDKEKINPLITNWIEETISKIDQHKEI